MKNNGNESKKLSKEFLLFQFAMIFIFCVIPLIMLLMFNMIMFFAVMMGINLIIISLILFIGVTDKNIKIQLSGYSMLMVCVIGMTIILIIDQNLICEIALLIGYLILILFFVMNALYSSINNNSKEKQ
jgi:hypothetical protein